MGLQFFMGHYDSWEFSSWLCPWFTMCLRERLSAARWLWEIALLSLEISPIGISASLHVCLST